MLGLSCGMWDLVPWPGIEHRPFALGAIGPQGSLALIYCETLRLWQPGVDWPVNMLENNSLVLLVQETGG